MSILSIPTPARFDLESAVCRYGYYQLAPNVWDKPKRALHRPLRCGDRTVVMTRTTQSRDGQKLRVVCDRRVSRLQAHAIKRQITRMLRLEEDFAGWYRVNPNARQRGDARLFRSPTLFEDMIKTITVCNVTWSTTILMNRLLCEHVGKGAFPTARQLANYGAVALKANCKVGYRAERIVRLARDVCDGTIELDWFETTDAPTDAVFEALRAIYGFGDYAAANVLQHVCRYDRLAIDSETYRHFREVHQVATPRDSAGLRRLHRKIEAHYAKFTPYQFLAYWFELWRGYG